MGSFLDWLIEQSPKLGQLIGEAFNSVENLFLVTEGDTTKLTFFAQALGIGVLASMLTIGLRAIVKAIKSAKVSV